jgi:hypothetical protein
MSALLPGRRGSPRRLQTVTEWVTGASRSWSLGLGALLEGDVHRATHALKEVGQRSTLGGQDRSGDHPPAPVPDGSDGGCLVHVEPNILGSPLHESRSLVLSW